VRAVDQWHGTWSSGFNSPFISMGLRLQAEVRAFHNSFLNFLGLMSPFSRMIGDVVRVLALPISDYEQSHVLCCDPLFFSCMIGVMEFCCYWSQIMSRRLDRSQDRQRAMSSFGGKSGVSYSSQWCFLRKGWRCSSSQITLEILVFLGYCFWRKSEE